METMSGKTFNILFQIGVYAWKRANGQYLYIGMSVSGLGRAARGHHVIGKRAQILDDDVFEFYPCETNASAGWLEAQLIRQHRPTYCHEHCD
jgi:excinuclease UvrABC nuclease subunit